jgi:cell division protease FtsH
MEKQDKSQLPNQKSADKRPPQQSGNVVWYLLGLGVILLLLVTVFNTGKEQDMDFSDFQRLVAASNPDKEIQDRFIDIQVDRGAAQPQTVRISDLTNIVIGENEILAHVTRRSRQLQVDSRLPYCPKDRLKRKSYCA